jgi:hypothetical protein
MPGDEQDKAGVVAPPPLIYLAALVLACSSTEGLRLPFCRAP